MTSRFASCLLALCVVGMAAAQEKADEKKNAAAGQETKPPAQSEAKQKADSKPKSAEKKPGVVEKKAPAKAPTEPATKVTKPAAKPAPAKKVEAPATPKPAPKEAAAPKTSESKKPDSEKKPAGDKGDEFENAQILAGHSQHGEAFNEGPRQQAYLMGGTGPVRFPATTKNEKARKLIEQGLGQLHGFWYFEAERSFRQAANLDPECAIAYWGMAKANSRNSKRSKEFIENAMERKDKASDLEQRLIVALNENLNFKGKSSDKAKAYTKKLKEAMEAYPNVLEVKALLGYEYYRSRSQLKMSYEDVDKFLNEIIAVEPLHPVHHYRIHLWDYKDPSKALNSSALCGTGSPAIAHMWHMPGHIYSRLKRYQDACWQQEASARVDHAHMMRDRVLPDQIHNFAHNNEWLTRNLNYVGRWQDAIDLAKNMIELPRHPKYNTLTRRGSTYYGRLRLFETLHRYEKWQEMVAYCNSTYLPPTDRSSDQLTRLKYLGIAQAELGNKAEVDKILAELQKRLDKAIEEEKKKKKTASKSKSKKGRRRPSSRSPKAGLEKMIAQIKGHVALQAGKYEEALSLLKKGGEDSAVQARVQSLAGKHDDAVKATTSFESSRKGQTQPLAARVEVLWRANKKEDAKKTFEALRAVSGSVQFGSPVFDRLSPIAKELGFEGDWRVSHKHPKDFGPRPKLSSLGPFRWQPMPAETWSLPQSDGSRLSLEAYRGKPVVVIFYLGYGCLHCAEQLKAFAPKIQAFKDAGIDVVAISSDGQEDLKKSIDNYEGGMPFPIVGDKGLDIFKSYRAYDDFEKTPLHGTFLIDAQGLIRWQDISFEPFMDPDFVIKEAQRLLAQPVSRPTKTASR